MTRTSYPIVLKNLIALLLVTLSGTATFARGNGIGQIQQSPHLAASNAQLIGLFGLFVGIILLSIFYRRFMYNRLLAKPQANERNLQPISTSALSPEDRLLQQLVEVVEEDESAKYQHIINNLQDAIRLMQPTGNVTGDEEFRRSISHHAHRIFTLTTIHDRFYIADNNSRVVDFNEIVPLLIENLSLADGAHARIQFIFSSPSRSIELDIRQAMAFSQVINEILFWFATPKSANYFTESVGIYLQENKGQVKLTVRTEGLNLTKDLRTLRRNLVQCIHAHFPDHQEPLLQVDESMGTSINFQVLKRGTRVSTAI